MQDLRSRWKDVVILGPIDTGDVGDGAGMCQGSIHCNKIIGVALEKVDDVPTATEGAEGTLRCPAMKPTGPVIATRDGLTTHRRDSSMTCRISGKAPTIDITCSTSSCVVLSELESTLRSNPDVSGQSVWSSERPSSGTRK